MAIKAKNMSKFLFHIITQLLKIFLGFWIAGSCFIAMAQSNAQFDIVLAEGRVIDPEIDGPRMSLVGYKRTLWDRA